MTVIPSFKLTDIVYLNLGCGKDILPGYINVDQYPGDGVDVVCDFKDKIPFPDNSINHIFISHVLEHFLEWEKVMFEIYRVLKPHGTVTIKAPYGIKGFTSVYHYRYFMPETMNPFCLDANGIDIARTLEPLLDFEKIDVHVNNHFQYRYHMKKYLHWNIPESKSTSDGPDRNLFDRWFGEKYEIVYKLRKPIHNDTNIN